MTKFVSQGQSSSCRNHSSKLVVGFVVLKKLLPDFSFTKLREFSIQETKTLSVFIHHFYIIFYDAELHM